MSKSCKACASGAAFICDIGTSPDVLAQRYPHHDFAHIPEQWWHPTFETPAQVVARADVFRELMAGCEDSATTLLVSHWAFVLALTGVSLTNGELIEYDPRSPPPRDIDWEL